MTDLHLPLKREHFEQIRDGVKTEEYRLFNDYWRRRLTREWPPSIPGDEGKIVVNRHYDRIILTLGYPRRDDGSRRIIRPYRWYTIKTIVHPHFGPDPVQVFAIDVRPE